MANLINRGAGFVFLLGMLLLIPNSYAQEVVVVGESEEEPAEQWQSIEGEGEAPCKTSETYDKGGVLNAGGMVESDCAQEEGPTGPKYKKASYQGSKKCSIDFKKTDKHEAAFRHRATSDCWSCPLGYERSLNPDIEAADACIYTQPATSKLDYAEKLGNATNSRPHKKAFKDKGKWWRCPDNRPRRTAYKVTSNKACATEKIIGEKLASAIDLGKIDNPKPAGAFKDPRNGGEYWKCPKGYDRTVQPVTSPSACEKAVPAKTLKKKAKYRGINSGTCPLSSFENGLSGKCYSCPDGYRRSAVVTSNPAKEPKACVRND